jgi:hypothetical protein
VPDSIIIIPTYNEKENIERMIRKVFSLPHDFHVLLLTMVRLMVRKLSLKTFKLSLTTGFSLKSAPANKGLVQPTYMALNGPLPAITIIFLKWMPIFPTTRMTAETKASLY